MQFRKGSSGKLKSIVRVEGLSKQYRIGARETAYDTLREAIVDTVRAPLRRLRQMGRNGSRAETIWALKDVSFEVEPGEALGIVGHNGAGKSTLLKILSRITEPTSGRVELFGRVGSLLEVGTGFHPELTGKENVYLNGAILGMRKAEIERKFDEIVAFAEIEKFIDTPVKWYSSGMYMRLAFAVAANFEPEILIVDEVLAVGDGPFQKKCLEKMGEISHAGRTVIFVSHNMSAIEALCNRVLWLVDGKLVEEAETEKVVSDYVTTELVVSTERVWNDPSTAPGNDEVRLHRVRVRPESESPSDFFTMQTPFFVEVDYWNLVPDAQLHITLHLHTEQGIVAFTTGSISEPAWENRHFPEGLFRSICYIPGNLLNAGFHYFDVFVVKDQRFVIFLYPNAVTFEVVDVAERCTGREPGIVQPALKWTTELMGTTPG